MHNLPGHSMYPGFFYNRPLNDGINHALAIPFSDAKTPYPLRGVFWLEACAKTLTCYPSPQPSPAKGRGGLNHIPLHW